MKKKRRLRIRIKPLRQNTVTPCRKAEAQLGPIRVRACVGRVEHDEICRSRREIDHFDRLLEQFRAETGQDRFGVEIGLGAKHPHDQSAFSALVPHPRVQRHVAQNQRVPRLKRNDLHIASATTGSLVICFNRRIFGTRNRKTIIPGPVSAKTLLQANQRSPARHDPVHVDT